MSLGAYLVFLWGVGVVTSMVCLMFLQPVVTLEYRTKPVDVAGGEWRPLGPTGLAIVICVFVLLWPVSLPLYAINAKSEKQNGG